MGKPAKAGFDILMSYEDWLLIRNGELCYTSEEMNNIPLSTVHHFIGFDLGQNAKEKAEQELAIRKNKAKRK